MRLRLLLMVAVIVLLVPRARADEQKPAPPPTTAAATLSVSARPWGVSTRYVGGTEGNMRFDIADLTDCGINTLRIYGDMSRFEPTDDDGVYGSPTIAEIKADPEPHPLEAVGRDHGWALLLARARGHVA